MFRVALDTPLRRLFDYLPPGLPDGAVEPVPGMRVRVPFGRRRLIGVVMETGDSSELPQERLKPILEVLDARPLLDSAALELIRWAAEYYHHPIGQVLASALPKALRLGAGTAETQECWAVTGAGAAAAAVGEPRRAPRQRALLDLLICAGGNAAAQALDEKAGDWRDAARALKERGYLTRTAVEVSAAVEPARLRVAGPELLPEQHAAVEAVAGAVGTFRAFLLEGVTGSGKTEVYLRLAEQVLA